MRSPRALAISARGLARSFGDVRAVAGIDLDVRARDDLRGARAERRRQDDADADARDAAAAGRGRGRVMGHDLLAAPRRVRASIAMTGQFASLDEDLTGRENLVLVARLWGFGWRGSRRRADELLAAFDLADAAGRQVKDYSGGMRRRLDIAASLVVTPGVLFLDEPTTGLDPTARQEVWRMIRGLAQAGVTILLTTQYLDEADQLADRIAVIDHGRKIAEGTSRELKAATGSGMLHVAVADPGRLEEAAALLEARLGAPVSAASRAAGSRSPAAQPRRRARRWPRWSRRGSSQPTSPWAPRASTRSSSLLPAGTAEDVHERAIRSG